MKTFTLFFAIALLTIRATAAGGQIDLDFAFSQLKGNGPGPFVNALYQDRDVAQRLLSRMDPLVQGAGPFQSYEIVAQRFLTKKVERVVVVLYFEKFPVYMRIDFYETIQGRIALPAIISKEASEILPVDIISASGK